MRLLSLMLLLLVFMAVPHLATAAGRYWQSRASGWFWYAAPPPKPVIVLPAVRQPIASLVSQVQPVPQKGPQATDYDLAAAPELEAHKALQRRLLNSRVIAIMAPTFANLRRYLYTQREVMERASVFADTWQRVVWADPELDYGARQRPTYGAAVRVWDEQQRQRKHDVVRQLATDHGLFFLFGKECRYCAQMAQTLQRFALRHGMEVQAVAVDGAQHAAFPDAWPDNGFAAASGVRQLPVLLLARLAPGVEEVMPIAYGPLADAELEERIMVLNDVPIGERF